MIEIAPGLRIEESEIEERFIRASGPGGQNVNKLSSAVELRFDLRRNTSLPYPVQQRIADLAGRRLSREGVVVIRAERFRSQDQNRADAMERLAALIREAGAPPPPPRKKTRTPRSAVRARLTDKKAVAGRKAQRRRPGADD